MKLIYCTELSLLFSLIPKHLDTFVLCLCDFRSFIMWKSQSCVHSQFCFLIIVESATSQVLFLWIETCHFSKLSLSTWVAFTSVLDVLGWPVWATSLMSVQPFANSVCHFLSLCSHYAVIIHLHHLINLNEENIFFRIKTPFLLDQVSIVPVAQQHASWTESDWCIICCILTWLQVLPPS